MKRATRKLIGRAAELSRQAGLLTEFMGSAEFETLPEFNQQQFRDRAKSVADEMDEITTNLDRVES